MLIVQQEEGEYKGVDERKRSFPLERYLCVPGATGQFHCCTRCCFSPGCR